MAIANTPVTISRPGEPRAILSLFEVLVRRLAAGHTSRRNSSVPFIKLVIACVGQHAPVLQEPPSPPHPGDTAVLDARARLDVALASGSDADVDRALSDVLRAMRASAHRNRD